MSKHYFSRRRFVNSMMVLGGSLLAGPRAVARNLFRAGRMLDWPAKQEWDKLKERVGGRLIRPRLPWLNATPTVFRLLKNPFWNEEDPGALQSTGWLDAWSAVASPYAVKAANTQDIVEAVDFSRRHKVKLVVKGTGHDYLGRNCAADSLLVWTHAMRDIQLHDVFVPAGAPQGTRGVQAMTVEAGTRWLEAYQVATRTGRYVQGGGCTSVGACGGFTLGSGFGSFSKRFGTGSAGILQAEVITADGKVRIVNRFREPDLFFAIRGGGGGTFGIVARLTLLTHPMPASVGLVTGQVTATSDKAYRELIRRFIEFYPRQLNNPWWGESVHFDSQNRLGFRLVCLDKTLAETEATMDELLAGLRERPGEYKVEPQYLVTDFKNLWNCDYWEQQDPGFVTRDPRPGTPGNQFWWKGNEGELSVYWNAYQSWWIPTTAMRQEMARLADAFFEASRLTDFIFQINKGLSGEHAEARNRDLETALHPACFDAAGLVLMGSSQGEKYVGVQGREPDLEAGRKARRAVGQAMQKIREVIPNSGSYANEADFFLEDWQNLLWGANYPRLLAVKQKYDPANFFKVHHGVGSEAG